MEPGQTNQYTQAGVNVSLGDTFSSLCGKVCRGSYQNSRFVHVHDFSKGHFRGRRGWVYLNLPSGTMETGGADGIGTKVIIIDAAGLHYTAGDNLLAMLGEDFTRDGCMGLICLNLLDVATLGKGESDPTFIAAEKLMLGLGESAKQQGYVLATGETAELRDCVTSENPDATLKFNWGAVMIGALHPDKLITGDHIQAGDRVIALKDVTRSNGISLLRKGLRHRHGEKWYANTTQEALDDIREAATPSALYNKFLVHANGWTTENFEPVVKANLIAHLSGGGIKSKFGDDQLFPRGWSADLSDLWEPAAVLRKCAEDLKIPDEECYEAWGGGQGVLAVVREKDADPFIALAASYGIPARAAGCIHATETGCEPSIRIASGFSGKSIKLLPKL